MRLDFPPKYTETIGAVKIHSLQKICIEIDSGTASGYYFAGHLTVRRIALANNTLSQDISTYGNSDSS